MTYNDAIKYIHSISWTGSRPGLERITRLCELMGNPQDDLTIIHVAGTNGKGSFCAMLESILRTAGYTTGMFTSPFVEHFNERFCYNGDMISESELAEIVEYVRPFAEQMEDFPTEFEFITAVGFEYFRRKKCDIVVLEAGMGGRLDSTNVVKSPLFTMITGIAFDHMEYLGDTIEKIAAEKAGIIKSGRPLLFGGRPEAAKEVIKAKAAEKNSPFYLTDTTKLQNIIYTLDGTTFDFGDLHGLMIPLLSFYQPYNAANVLSAVEILRKHGLTITNNHIRHGLSSVKWKGRFEKLSSSPPVYFDGGHNVEGVQKSVESIAHYFPNGVNLIFGVMRDKKYEDMVALCAKVTKMAFCTTVDNPRAILGVDLSREFDNHYIPATASLNVEQAVELAIKAHKINGLPIFALGSLYMYSELKAALINNGN